MTPHVPLCERGRGLPSILTPLWLTVSRFGLLKLFFLLRLVWCTDEIGTTDVLETTDNRGTAADLGTIVDLGTTRRVATFRCSLCFLENLYFTCGWKGLEKRIIVGVPRFFTTVNLTSLNRREEPTGANKQSTVQLELVI